MEKIEKPAYLILLSLLAVSLVFILENILKAGGNGTLLFTILFWTSIAQGCVAIVAAADLAKGGWIRLIKRELLSFYPMILIMAMLFLILSLKINEIYPWTKREGAWLNTNFFIARNFLLLFLSFYFGHQFAKESSREGARKNLFAVLYLLSFIVSQTIMSFDLIMSLEYPWYSTLFGAYNFVESIYSGIGIGAIVTVNILKVKHQDSDFRKVLVDTATMLFGFALLWAGLFYAQYLVIWYGNLPEEVSFLLRRTSHSPLKEMGYLVITSLFVLPFVILLSKKAKGNPAIVLISAFIVLLGLFVERLVYILPHLDVNPVVIFVEFVILFFVSLKLNTNKELFFA